MKVLYLQQSHSFINYKVVFGFLQGTMIYKIIGDMPAPTYFGIRNTTGALFIKADLKDDTLFTYLVAIVEIKAQNYCSFQLKNLQACVNIFPKYYKIKFSEGFYCCCYFNFFCEIKKGLH